MKCYTKSYFSIINVKLNWCYWTVNQLGAENPHFHVKMAMTVLVLELQGGKKIRMSLMSSLKVYKI